ncbi:GNAT family N-acetyltransferase [Algoriphagus sp. CAU 1675]|uniref:GNAT family N-acetyltransferase n=1 Tax=Algoriphagus sp. CAU 1675 TaxID=3032597 RepID=UPI0023DBE219|nr:GNAT family N-acetyltransferase [Algoriphagus sp. CAU 1675]MDF2157247.1 GNAT family N-acetyltransferase [Algoriphagus sp. CAU 1675]
MNSPLDNPIWNALNTSEIDKNIGTDKIAFFDPEIAPFIGLAKWDEAHQQHLLECGPENRNWFLLIAERVDFLDKFEIGFTTPTFQLTCQPSDFKQVKSEEIEIQALNPSHVDEMIELTALTKPGPFTKRTIEFGNYHGIFEGGKLVAMGGERMHLDEFTEVSAICTHPDYLGKGYGAHIVSHLTESILQKGKIPFLHARQTNLRAINVYKRIGYEIRSEIIFYMFRKKTD